MTAHATSTVARRPISGGGFTLIELIAVMVIVAIMAAAAVPSLEAMSGTRSAMAGKQLLRDLTFARQYATATGAPVWVVFDSGAETWSVLAEDPDNPGRAGATILVDPATGRSYIERLGVGSMTGVGIASVDFDADAEVGFDWLGRPLSSSEAPLAAEGTVTLTGGHQVTVTVDTGHVAYVAP